MDQFIFHISLSILALLWATIIILLGFGLRRLSGSKRKHTPTVTVLVAARNEEASIGETVAALTVQEYPPDKLEIVIIDDGSTDRTAEIARSTTIRCSFLKLIPAPPSQENIAPKKNALLAGIAASTGEIIMTTDADCVPGTGWIRSMIESFDYNVIAVAGYSPVSGSIAGFDTFVNGVISAGTIGLGYPVTAVGRNFAYRRTTFEAIGGFGNTISGASGDDDLLLQRLAAAGGKVAFATDPATFVPARGAESFSDWLRMKRRHLSAGARYTPGLVGLFTLLYLFHAGLIAAVFTSIAGITSWWLTGSIWSVKAFADYLTLQKGAGLLKQDDWRWRWAAAEIVSPLLVCVMTPLALFGRVKWKGRSLNR